MPDHQTDIPESHIPLIKIKQFNTYGLYGFIKIGIFYVIIQYSIYLLKLTALGRAQCALLCHFQKHSSSVRVARERYCSGWLRLADSTLMVGRGLKVLWHENVTL